MPDVWELTTSALLPSFVHIASSKTGLVILLSSSKALYVMKEQGNVLYQDYYIIR